MTEFEKKVKIALIRLGKSQKWLIEQIEEKTGGYMDHSYLRRILTGKCNTPKMVKAISDILNL